MIGAGRRVRQLQRYRTIAAAFARNGLGYAASEMGLADKLPFFRKQDREEMHAKSLGERIRLLLEELGPTFVKLGQIASTRPDLLPADILQELTGLQDKVHEFPYEEAARILEEELGAPPGELFADFSQLPIAAASIGQVYMAWLEDGTRVAVKVQRPDIQALIETDLDILADWARMAEARLEWARRYRLGEVVDELGRALRTEMDYMAEARNTDKFRTYCKAQKGLIAPEVIWEYCTKRVLTTGYIEGIKLSDRAALEQAGLSGSELAERFTASIFHQILVAGYFHADPHPGNVLGLTDGRLAFIDFGMVGRLAPGMRKHFASFIIALRNQSTRGVLRAISHMGVIPDDADQDSLYADVDAMREKYYKVPLNQISIGDAVNDLFGVAFRHRIRVPTELTLLGKSLLTMEGVVTALDPDISIFDVAEPFGKKLFLERLDPRQTLKSWMEDVPEAIDLLSEVPQSIRQLAKVMRQGKLGIEAESPQLDTLMKKLDRISNRLAFSIVLLSISIVMVGLIIGSSLNHSQTLLWRIPVIEIGFVGATGVFIWLIYAIFRSGRF